MSKQTQNFTHKNINASIVPPSPFMSIDMFIGFFGSMSHIKLGKKPTTKEHIMLD